MADLLTFHRVRWTYEPTTFVLKRHHDGQLAECFRPDFYLPDHRIYLELTTMRQAHVTRKNRKLRRLRSLYPGAQVRVLYRRDLERILNADARLAPSSQVTIGETVVESGMITARLQELAQELEMSGSPDLMVALDREALPAARLLAASFRLAPELLSLTGFRPGLSRDPIRVLRGLKSPVRGRRVLLVAGRLGTGLRCTYARQWLERQGAAHVDLVTLIDQPDLQLIPVPLRASGFTFHHGAIAGFGLEVGGRFGDVADLVSVAGDDQPG